MEITVNAIYEGENILLLKDKIPFKPKTPVIVKITEEISDDSNNKSFLKLAQSLNLDGPEDWSENLEEYLYGDRSVSK